MSEEDYLLALKLQEKFNNEHSSSNTPSFLDVHKKKQPTTSIVDAEWETMDPNPDIHQLFQIFNVKFFWNALGSIEVKWSPRMYTCAGICTYKGKAGCVVSLSLPLLQLRPRKDLLETLLHEMIHAYLFVTKNNKDRGSHGPEFCKHMARINKEAGTQITIYHSFHDEVDHYKTHVWRCNYSCRANPPYFGYVRRAVNRAPGPNDFWFAEHQRTCGGTFEKVGEPENFKSKPRKKAKLESNGNKKETNKAESPSIIKGQKDLRTFFPSSVKNTNLQTSTKEYSSTSKSVHGVQHNQKPNSDIVNHGGIKNNIFGFGNLSGSHSSKEGLNNEIKNSVSTPGQVPAVPFSGKGYILGSTGVNDRSKSRLLGIQKPEPKAIEINSPRIPASNVDSFVDLTKLENRLGTSINQVLEDESSDDEDPPSFSLNCPVCNVLIKDATINEHLDECAQLESVFNSSQNEILSSSESDSEDYPMLSPPSPDTDGPVSPPTNVTVSCPNCTADFTTLTINEHLDRCLSFD